MSSLNKDLYIQGVYWSIIGLILFSVAPDGMSKTWMFVDYMFSISLLFMMIQFTAKILLSLTHSEHRHEK